MVHGLFYKHAPLIPLTAKDQIDLTNFPAVKRLWDGIRPDAVIHAAAQAKINDCENAPDLSRRINIDASENIARFSAKASIPFLFTSTDQVFSGRNAPYQENDPTDPVHIYGAHKAAAEEAVLAANPKALICRMPLLFGLQNSPSGNFFPSFVKDLKEHKPCRLFIDEFRTPLSASSAACGLLKLIGRISGILHCGGAVRLSRYAFGVRVARCLKLENPSITACHQADMPMAAARPPDLSMNSRQAHALGYPAPNLDDDIQNACQERAVSIASL